MYNHLALVEHPATQIIKPLASACLLYIIYKNPWGRCRCDARCISLDKFRYSKCCQMLPTISTISCQATEDLISC